MSQITDAEENATGAAKEAPSQLTIMWDTAKDDQDYDGARPIDAVMSFLNLNDAWIDPKSKYTDFANRRITLSLKGNVEKRIREWMEYAAKYYPLIIQRNQISLKME